MKIRVAGAWLNANKLWTRVSGVWREVRYGYVNVGGTWRRMYRANNAMFDGTITMGSTVFGGVTSYGYSRNNYGTISSPTTKNGLTIATIQVAEDGRGSYGAFRWLQISFSGNNPTVDVARARFNGVESAALIAVNWVEVYQLTEVQLGYNSNLPSSGTIPVMF